MPRFTSNSAELHAELRKISLSFGFEATIEGRTLGEDIAGITADMIAARSIDEQRGAGDAWPDISDDPPGKGYKSRKMQKYGVDLIGVRTGQMLSIESLLGGTTVTTDEVRMLYGTGRAPTGSGTGMGFDPDTDGSITDIEKAYFFSEARPFYELDDAIADAVFARIEECCEQYLLSAW